MNQNIKIQNPVEIYVDKKKKNIKTKAEREIDTLFTENENIVFFLFKFSLWGSDRGELKGYFCSWVIFL